MTSREVTPIRQQRAAMVELGAPSNRKHSAYYDEFLPQLRGHNAIRVYREMADNDATIGEILFAIEMLIRGIDWTVVPGGETPADVEAAAFLESCMDDMSHTWPDFISNVVSMLPYGWAFFELVYKQRIGDDSDFDDGRIGWKKIAYQRQETLTDWELDDDGGLAAFKWSADGKTGEIPMEKGLLFRTTTARGPSGRSMLRNAYVSYMRKKRIEDYIAIGIERDLNGMPIGRIPADIILEGGAEYEAYKKAITRIKKDEQWGAIWPLEYDADGNSLYEFELMRGNAGESIRAAMDVHQQLAQDIAGVVVAEFIFLGRTSVGAKAVAEPKQEMFQMALQAWVDSIAAVLNRYAVPRLFALNNFPRLTAQPSFKPERIRDVSLQDISQFIKDTSQAGMDWGFLDDDDPIRNEIRQLAGFDAAVNEPSVSFNPTDTDLG